MQDTTILYQGGSGGFLFFYYMLLSGEYTTGLDMENIEHYINNQYHPELILDKKSWKICREYWPNNLECKKKVSANSKLFSTSAFLHFSHIGVIIFVFFITFIICSLIQ